MDHTGLSAPGAADDAEGLPFPEGKTDVPQALPVRSGVGQPHMAEGHRLVSLDGDLLRGKAHLWLHRQDGLDTARAGHGLCGKYNRVCQLHQFHQDLAHIVDQGVNISIEQHAPFHLPRPHIEHRHDPQIHHRVGHGIHQRGQATYLQLHVRQPLIFLAKARLLRLLLPEGPHHPHPGEVLPGQAEHAVQLILISAVHGTGQPHEPEHNQAEDRYRHHKHQSYLPVNGKGQHHTAKDDEGGAHKQPQKHIQAVLHLVNIAGQPGDKGAASQHVYLREVQGLDVPEQVVAHGGGIADGRLGCKPLGRNGAGQTHHSQQHQQAAATQDNPRVSLVDAHVDDLRHD